MEASRVDGDDREIMARLAAGDREALAPLMELHYRRLYRIALAYLRQRDDALDVVQEAFVRAFQAAPRWDGTAAGPWLSRITVNLVDRPLAPQPPASRHLHAAGRGRPRRLPR